MFVNKRKMPTSRQIVYLCAICLLFFSALRVAAQLQFERWNEENGLPQNWVKSIYQRRDGVFTSITIVQGLPGDNVARIDEDAEGDLDLRCQRLWRAGETGV